MIFKKKKDRLLNKMIKGVDMIKVGTCRRLVLKYINQYGDNAVMLAGAVTNELFSGTPTDDKGRNFAESHKDIIGKEIQNLRDDIKIRTAVTQAVRVLATISYAHGDPQVGIGRIEKIEKLGILIPGGDEPHPIDFLEMAGEFLTQTAQFDI